MICVLVLLLFGVGCGDGDSTGTAETAAVSEQDYPWVKGASRDFLIPDGDNAVQSYGREGTPAEREQVARVIAPWMRARAAKEWAKDCSYFSQRFSRLITEDANTVTNGRVKTCPEALAFFGPEASGDFKNNSFGEGPVDSLRIADGKGYAQYHGNDGKDWVVPVDQEQGRWLVANAKPLNRLR